VLLSGPGEGGTSILFALSGDQIVKDASLIQVRYDYNCFISSYLIFFLILKQL